MYQICYISKSNIPEENLLIEIDEILEIASVKNLKLGITGILLYHNGWFCQYMESDSLENLHKLYGKICCDKRHTSISTIFTQISSKRVFSNWSMCFKKVKEPDQIEFVDYLKTLAHENKVLTNPEIKKVLAKFNYIKSSL